MNSKGLSLLELIVGVLIITLMFAISVQLFYTFISIQYLIDSRIHQHIEQCFLN
ncbi:MAG: hypothetical protein ABDH21_05975 [bacterium]